MALDDLGELYSNAEFDRMKEDVREKMLKARQLGSAYIEKPYCLGVIAEWFGVRQADLFNVYPWHVRIRGNASWCVEAGADLLMRAPYLRTKVKDSYQRWLAASHGIVIQQHISEWIRYNWPDAWLPPDNYQNWGQWCDHDFKLKTAGKTWKVDVMGPRRDEMFGMPAGGGKRPVDLHLFGQLDGEDVVLNGYLRGDELEDSFAVENTKPMYRIIVRLNCDLHGPSQLPAWNYELLRSFVRRMKIRCKS